MKKHLSLLLRVVVSVGILAYLFNGIFRKEAAEYFVAQNIDPDALTWWERTRVFWTVGPSALWDVFRGMNLLSFMAAVACFGGVCLCGTVRWRMILHAQGLMLGFWRTISIFLIGHFFNAFMLGATGGDVMKALYAAHETHHKKAEAVSTVLVDRVVGLMPLIALAIEGWIDDRRDARMERQYLELLLRDLDRDLQVLGEVAVFEEAQAAASNMVYRALRTGVEPCEREAVAAALGQLTARRTLRLGRATYTDLLSTGNLRLIRNADLRDSIVRLYEASERAQVIRDRINQEFVDRMYITYLLDQGLVAPRPVRNLPAIATPDRKFAERTNLATDTALDRIWQLPPEAPQWLVLSNRVCYRGLASEGAIEQSRLMTAEIQAVRDLIDAELTGRRPR